MKYFVLLIAFIPLFASANEFTLSRSVFLGKSVPSLKFEGPGQFDNYLVMNIPFSPVAQVFQQLQKKVKRPLIHRGEAHITVVTPIEYWNVLRPRGITMKEINQIAESFDIQKSHFNALCVGQGNALIGNQIQSTYFIVVNSPDLVNLRKVIQTLLIRKGGSANQFIPHKYYPHITLGFTKDDLHESNGVIKDIKSCVGRLDLAK